MSLTGRSCVQARAPGFSGAWGRRAGVLTRSSGERGLPPPWGRCPGSLGSLKGFPLAEESGAPDCHRLRSGGALTTRIPSQPSASLQAVRRLFFRAPSFPNRILGPTCQIDQSSLLNARHRVERSMRLGMAGPEWYAGITGTEDGKKGILGAGPEPMRDPGVHHDDVSYPRSRRARTRALRDTAYAAADGAGSPGLPAAKKLECD
jgi:hypothetical protein